MSKNEDIYKLLITISEDIGLLKERADSIHDEVKKTNGRVTRLEELNTESRINWAKLSTIFSIALFLLVAAFNFAVDWLKTRLIN